MVNLFQIKKYFDNQYFIEPTDNYYKKYGYEFIHIICPKYSYGYENKLCFCKIYIDMNNNLHISHFNNYVRNYFVLNKKIKEYNDSIYKGLGIFMLKNILIKFSDDTKVMLDMVDIKNKKLINFYEKLSFIMYDEDNFCSNVKNILSFI